MLRASSLILALIVLGVCASPNQAQDLQVGREVVFVERLRADGTDKQIPLHANVGERAVSDRLPSNSTASIVALGTDPHRHWIQVRAGNITGWVVTRYVASVGNAQPGTGAGTATTYVIGCWNLEHFRSTAQRGFPENTRNGPSLPPRTTAQIQEVAQTITQNLGAQLLALSEINGEERTDADGDRFPASDELDALMTALPDPWDYYIAWSGNHQRIAIIFNGDTVRVNEVQEFVVAPRRIQNKDIFDRDPLAAHVTFLRNGQPMNDLVVVAVHLASGQRNSRNHDEAMRVLRQRLTDSQAAGELGGSAEHDVVIMGDYNANMFRTPVEQFFLEMDEPTGNWDVLAGDNYPATRLSGVPLALRTSEIDYIIASRSSATRTGLVGQEIQATSATVHTSLVQAQGSANNFRRDLSDHLPVTVAVSVVADND